ncbi:uncharacterized protein LOC108117671, partial [Drosophila eugracilis]|uniref:uncharacterized protein LOC108117671 n=1 Tax=Drosophila eugracilis TaxID=29029 RepID=UPI001BD9C7D8
MFIMYTFRRVRIVVYKVISSWCSTLQQGSQCEIILDTLIKEILVDLIPYHPTTLKNRAESRLKGKRSTENGFSMFEQPIGNEESGLLRQHAMFCLQNFLLSSGHLLKPQLFKKSIFYTLKSLLFYYNSFEFLLKSQNYRCPAPTEIILGLLNESNLFVNSIALRKTYNLKDLEPMLRAQKADTR